MNKKINKLGNSKLVLSQIVYIILIVVFSVVMIAYVVRSGNQSSVKEEIYAKQIALAIDKARVGTEIDIDISDLYKFAESNKYKGQIINIDNQKNLIQIYLAPGAGHSYRFFSNSDVLWNINLDEEDKPETLLIYIS
jgi:hypothetical protein